MAAAMLDHERERAGRVGIEYDRLRWELGYRGGRKPTLVETLQAAMGYITDLTREWQVSSVVVDAAYIAWCSV